ncbi:cobalamin biosynthesis protein [Aphanizomenon sp. CS-733/32]|uniref:cobalamin biosynthesis protein n=1 Tax=Aphanizomenon sp. CS-733/32 TaxID=3021715 RepID=UPI00232C301F|nr:cobalamin biosynthesis protein [Aphanizomenon sp. CS-733/32]MDB9307770.1 cobalamin biosynthesis protein [Aphanizomenon sp. CS-733/32]
MAEKRKLWVGIGCQKGVSQQLINTAIKQVFQEYQLIYSEISGIATIDKKASEIGLLEFCNLEKLLLKVFSAELLNSVLVPHPNNTITKLLGTSSVAEASAILAASEITSAEITLLVPKQIFRLSGEIGAVTVAVAKSDEKLIFSQRH